MKPVVLTLTLLAFLLASLYSVAMIAKNTEPLKVTTPLEARSIIHTKEETFKVDLYLNTLHSMYIYEEAMMTHTLRDTNKETVLPITLKDASYKKSREGGEVLRLTYALDIESSSEPLYLREAALHIEYSDQAVLEIPIGEFTYLYESDMSNTLDYVKSTPIKGDYGYGDTVVGHCVSLVNKSSNTLTIKDLSLNLDSIKPNLDYMHLSEGPITPLMGLEAIMDDAFNPKNPSLAPKSHALLSEETATLCVPFTYEKDRTLKRYALSVEYLENGRVKTLSIDDFSYLDTGFSDETGVKGVGVIDQN